MGADGVKTLGFAVAMREADDGCSEEKDIAGTQGCAAREACRDCSVCDGVSSVSLSEASASGMPELRDVQG